MTADLFAQPSGRGSTREPFVRAGRYRLFSPETGKEESWTRATTFAKAISDAHALTKWQLRNAVHGIGQRPDLYALACAAELKDRATLDDVAHQAMQAAKASSGANLGTAMHTFSERVDRGELDPESVAPMWRKPVQGYADRMAAAELEVVQHLIEVFVVVPRFRVCGRLDRVLRCVDTDLHVIGDGKSTRNISYSWAEIEIQLALYANASHYWSAEADDWVEMPRMDLRTGYVMHFPVTLPEDPEAVAGGAVAEGCTDLYAIDIENGMRGCELAEQVRQWRKPRKLEPIPVETPAYADRLKTAGSVDELIAIWNEAYPLGAWTAELEAVGLARQQELLAS